MPDDLKDSILSIFEASLDAQLRAVRRLRGGAEAPAPTRRRASLSQVDMAFDILKKAHRPSCLDLVTRLRQELVDHPECPPSLGFQLADRALIQAADA